MSSARRRQLGGPTGLWACLVALAFVALWGPGPASADDPKAAAAAAPAPATDAEAHTAPAPAVSAPASAVKADSAAVKAAVRDSLPKGAAKEPEPAEHPENAPAVQAEKASAPGAVKQGDAAGISPAASAVPKATTPKPTLPKATRPVAARGVRPRPVSRAPSTRRRGEASKSTAARSLPTHESFTEADRVSAELERTERFVGRAQKSILLSKNTRAIKLFTSALDFQSDSREAYKVRQYARAERLTLASRDFADRASRMVGPPREDPDYVEHVLRRTDDALDRTKDVLKTGAGRDAWAQHDQLREEQKDAWSVFRNGDVASAYKQTLGVREGVLVLLRQLQDLPVPRETAEKAIGGAEAALEQANKELGPRPTIEAMRLVRLANEYLVKARQSFQHGSYRSALLQAKVVERHVEHAVDVGRPGSG